MGEGRKAEGPAPDPRLGKTRHHVPEKVSMPPKSC